MQLFYTPHLGPESSEFEFDTEEASHIVKVLRSKAGDIIETTNGKGYLFKVQILDANPKHCIAKVVGSRKEHHKRYHLHLAVAPTKNSSRYEWFLEKATEIGVHEITPILCDRSERRQIKPERLEKILLSAMKQSLRPYLPKLNKAIPFQELVDKPIAGLKCIAHCEDGDKTDLKRWLGADQDVTILIGPEGDFTRDEIQKARENGFHPVSLGDSRMRTETAAIMAVATAAIINSG